MVQVWVQVAAELCLAVVFGRALWLWTRTRNRVQGWVTAAFTPPVLVLLRESLAVAGLAVPQSIALAMGVLVVAMPWLMLRIAAQLRVVSGAVEASVLAVTVAAGVAVMLAPRPVPRQVSVAFGTVFAVSALVAAYYLAAEARDRPGSSRVRLAIAAAATVLLGGGVLADVWTVGGVWWPAVPILFGAGGYLVAFLPPRWLASMWAARAVHEVSRRLRDVPWTEPPELIWHRYVEAVRRAAAADAVAVVLRTEAGTLTQVGHSDHLARLPQDIDAADLDALLASRSPIDLAAPPAGAARLAACYAASGYPITYALPLAVPPAESGALLTLNERWGLFRDEDLRSLADVGAVAGILAERAAVIAQVQASDRAKSTFLSNMSHELRTPLNAVIGFSDLALSEPSQGGSSTVPTEWLRHIRSSGQHLLDLVNDLLDLSKSRPANWSCTRCRSGWTPRSPTWSTRCNRWRSAATSPSTPPWPPSRCSPTPCACAR
ncbi:MAG TPA: histidine kinase dimerization/phospho-acceptor domain-containing protein [Pilimelia sp.]|nr:histidine kinase dimerization/phospho-acceptor domain-containing protein [Pilimelia sp.]